MLLRTIMTELIALACGGPPTAETVAHAFAPRATSRHTSVGRKGDIVLMLNGDVGSMSIREDGRGWGAYVVLNVKTGSLADLEGVVGPTTPMARNPDDFHSGEQRAAYVTRAGKTIRVFTELQKGDATRIRSVTVHFQR